MKIRLKRWILKKPDKLRIFILILIKKIFNRYVLDYTESGSFLLGYFKYRVQQGPFKGMKYIDQSNGSVLFPKIVGEYEQEIHSVIEQIIARKYSYIIDVGCAEGYYAAGLAYRLKKEMISSFKVYGYDIDPIARENATQLITLNELQPIVEIEKELETGDFDRFNSNTVVICDIEGGELGLLQPEISPSLLGFDLLVEVHDAGVQNGRIKNTLSARFQATHDIKIFRHENEKKRLFYFIKPEHEMSLMNEGRTFGLEWMWMKRKIK